MSETQKTICEWSHKTFPRVANHRIASRANEELAEAIRAYGSNPNSVDGPVEAADTIIVLCVLADNFGVKLEPFSEVRDICESALTSGQLLTDANKFMANLLDCLFYSSDDRTAVHWILGTYEKLCYFIRRMGHNPAELVNTKMSVNRSRNWVKGPNGMHVRPGKLGSDCSDAPTTIDAVGVDSAGGVGKVSIGQVPHSIKLRCLSGEVEVKIGDRFEDKDAEWEIVEYRQSSDDRGGATVIVKPRVVSMPAYYAPLAHEDGTLDFCCDSVAAAMLTKVDGKPRSARGSLLTR